MSNAELPDAATMRTRALLGLGIAVVLSVASWFFLSRAADGGIERLAAIERGRAMCTRAWATAASRDDTMRIDRTALADTVDPRSDNAIRECGDLRIDATAKAPNPREMSGEPMPRGLR